MINDWKNIDEVSKTVLSMLPQQEPFRFVDRIIEISESHCVGTYRFKSDEYFYQGHFPGNPVTPGVILTESMAQIGVSSLSLYLLLRESQQFKNVTSYFTEAHSEFLKPVLPGDRIIVKAQKIYWRRKKIKCETKLYLESGELAAQAQLSGMGVIK